ncbi:MAG: hypothetical protein LBT59_14425 [Clostridiales bacterium]|nr:hypothetical protein [Clostridiales bacterium]
MPENKKRKKENKKQKKKKTKNQKLKKENETWNLKSKHGTIAIFWNLLS